MPEHNPGRESVSECVRTHQEPLVDTCQRCGVRFMRVTAWQAYCSDDCRFKARHEREVVIRPPEALKVDPKATLLDKAEALFRAHPGEWLDGMRFAAVAGRYASRSRIAECRTVRGMTIDHRSRRVTAHGQTFMVSEYRWVP